MAEQNDSEAQLSLKSAPNAVFSVLRPGPLAKKLVGYAMIAALGLGIIVALVQVGLDYRRENATLDTSINHLLSTAKPSAGYAVLALDNTAALQVLEGLLQTEYIIRGRVLDDGGSELAQLAKEGFSSQEGGAGLAGLVAGDVAQYQITLDDPRNGQPDFGVISIEVDRVFALQPFFDRAILVVTFGVLRNVLLALVLLAVFYYLLARPLQRFVTSLSTVDPKRPDSSVLEISEDHQDDELGLLATATRQLIDESRSFLHSMEAAQSSSTAKSMFLANVSHELRTPLTAILGYSALLGRSTGMTDEQCEKLSIINTSGRHLLTLINDVLDMSKIEAGRMTLREETFDLHQTIHDVIEPLRSPALVKKLTVTTDLASNLPHYVTGDGGKLRQILTNLIVNAVNYTDAGTVTLRARAHDVAKTPAAEAHCRLVFEVEDTGRGIAVEDIETIFDTFTQTAASTEASKGTGLGLTISRDCARLMGGDLTVTSVLGQGSVFTATIPVTISAAPMMQDREQRQVIGCAPNQPRRHILVVDDDANCRTLMEELLGIIDCETTQARNGKQAVALFRQTSPDLVLMDMRMPIMNGHDAIYRIKATPKGRQTPVIAVTASTFEEDRAQIQSSGADDLLRKPLEETQFFDTLKTHLGIEYIYAPMHGEASGTSDDEDRDLQPVSEKLETLAPDLIVELREAASLGQRRKLDELIDGLAEDHAPVARRLKSLANDYDHEKMLEFLDSGSAP